jgi:hypothetical protein
MFATIWAFLTDPANRAILAWLGGGLVVAAGGIWAVIKFFAKRPDRRSVTADRGSVAVGGDNRNSPINITPPHSSRR